MRQLKTAAPLVLSLLLSVPAFALRTEILAGTPATPSSVGAAPTVVTSGQALLRLSSGTVPSSLDVPLAAVGVVRLSDLGSGWILVGWNDSVSVSFRLAALKSVPGVEDAQPSHVYSVHRVPSDPLVSAQYALSKVDAFRGWEFETGLSSRVTIAVVDTGIDGTHAELSPKLTNTASLSYDPNCAAAPCAATANNPPTPACQHATEVAGVAAAASDNGAEVAGMSWGAQLVSYKVFADADCKADCSDASGRTCLTNDPAIISAINEAATRQNSPTYGQMVVNLSLGSAGACPAAVQTAVTNAHNAGVVIVAAAGNDGLAVNSPGNCTGLIPAGATDSSDAVAYFSSRGTELQTRGLVAPGVSVLTTAPGGGTSSPSGTSFSSPMVAGAAAILISAKPTLTADQVRDNLRAGADNLGLAATVQGAGRLNLYKSVYYTLNGSVLPAANGVNVAAKAFAFPNPVNLSSAGGVQFSVPPNIGGAVTDVKVYTLDGKFIRDLSAPIWDGKNTDGNKVATGVYMFVIKTTAGSSSGRVTVIR
ncbi:MAG: S8 family peptidase [Elusimicrobia bacterium]|nr:S8 family peptidase [Elusimicrobiota bacterium]